MEPGFSHEEDFDSNGKAKSHYLNSSQSYPVSLTSEKHPWYQNFNFHITIF